MNVAFFAVTFAALATGVYIVDLLTTPLGFVQDDYTRIVRAHQFGYLGVWHSLTSPVSTAFYPWARAFYRPVEDLLFAVLNGLFPHRVWPFHVAAILLLSGAGVVLVWIARAFQVSRGKAVIAAAMYSWSGSLFLAAAWPSAISSALAAFFVSVVLASSLRPGLRARVLGITACALGLLSKESTTTAPLMAALLVLVAQATALRSLSDWRANVRVVVRRTAGLWTTLACYLLLRLIVHSPFSQPPYTLGIGRRNLTNGVHLALFLLGLSSGIQDHLGARQSELLALLVWSFISITAITALRARRLLPITGVALSAIGCLSAVFLVQQPIYDYYVDVGALGMSLAVAGLLGAFRLGWSGFTLRAVTAVVLASVMG